MTNSEVFNQYGTEQWVIEQNLCFMLLEYFDNINQQPPINPITFVKTIYERRNSY